MTTTHNRQKPSKWPHEHIKSGGLVVYPTDTLWALGCTPWLPDSVEKLRRSKGLGVGSPFSVALPSTDALEEIAELGELGNRLVRRFLPGPLTLICPIKAQFQEQFTAVASADGLVGLRVPGLVLARNLLEVCGALISTSANLHNQAPAASLAEARQVCKALKKKAVRVDLIDFAGECLGRPSTIIKLDKARPKVIRYGAIGRRDLAKVKGFVPDKIQESANGSR